MLGTLLVLGNEQSTIRTFLFMPNPLLFPMVHHFHWNKFCKHLLNICFVLKLSRCLRNGRQFWLSTVLSLGKEIWHVNTNSRKVIKAG